MKPQISIYAMVGLPNTKEVEAASLVRVYACDMASLPGLKASLPTLSAELALSAAEDTPDYGG
jgi:hypothetical protein